MRTAVQQSVHVEAFTVLQGILYITVCTALGALTGYLATEAYHAIRAALVVAGTGPA